MTLTHAARRSLYKILWNFKIVKIQLDRNIRSMNRLYQECKDFWKWRIELSMLIPNENYDARHVENIDKWLFILCQANVNDELTDDQFMEMKGNFNEGCDALLEIISRPTR